MWWFKKQLHNTLTLLPSVCRVCIPFPWVWATLWLLWPIEYDRSDFIWLSRLGHRRDETSICPLDYSFLRAELRRLAMTKTAKKPVHMERAHLDILLKVPVKLSVSSFQTRWQSCGRRNLQMIHTATPGLESLQLRFQTWGEETSHLLCD